MIKEREANSWKSVSYAKSISGSHTYTKFPIVLRTTEQSIPTWNVKGNMVQSGTPTPTSPITPSECGERTENLLDINKIVAESACSVTITNNSIVQTNTGNNGYSRSNITFNGLDTTKTYRVSASYSNPNSSSINIRAYDSQNQAIAYSATKTDVIGSLSFAFTPTTSTCTIKLYSNTTATANNAVVTFSELMLIESSTAKPYEPYGYKLPIVSGNTTTNIYLKEPLRKIGGYADTIAADGTVTRVIGKYIFDGAETWDLTGNYPILRNADTYFGSYKHIKEITCKCSHINSVTNITSGETPPEESCCFWSGTASTFYFRSSQIAVENMNQYLAAQYSAGTPVTVWYVLDPPTTETTTTSAISTITGLNTIDVNTTLKPSEMSLTFDGYKLCKRQRYVNGSWT